MTTIDQRADGYTNDTQVPMCLPCGNIDLWMNDEDDGES